MKNKILFINKFISLLVITLLLIYFFIKTKSNKIIINFNKELVSDTKLDNTKFIFYKNESVGYSMLTIGKKSKQYYPETFFYEDSNRYINEQILLDIVDISVKNLK